MKINCYQYPQDDFLTDTVRDAMALFSLVPVRGEACQTVAKELPPGIIVVCNRLLFEEQCVVTEITYRGGSGELVIRQEVSPTDFSGEPAVAKRLVRLNLLALCLELTGQNPGPWGILRGVRPTKLVHKLLDKGLAAAAARRQMEQEYALNVAKSELISEIAVRQRPFLLSGPQAKKLVSIYVAVPYCPTRCLYCSFPAQILPRDNSKLQEFMAILEEDLLAAKQIISLYGLNVQNIYIGGGTPTSLPAAEFDRLLTLVTDLFRGPQTNEFTVEAGRPDSVNDEKIRAMHRAGVTRTSINPQTMQEKTLKLIGRSHTVRDIIVALEKMRYFGIPTVNMDIIVGLPGEGEWEIADTMRQITELVPDNLTVHTLAIKKGSLLEENKEHFPLPHKDVAATMLSIAANSARKMGMQPYYLYRQKYMAGNLENVGYAKPGRECIYNIQIVEERQTIIGIGPAAATKAVHSGDWRVTSCYQPKDIITYCKNIGIYLARRDELLAKLFEAEE